MTYEEYLLTHLSEEASEVIKAASKTLRFGPMNHWVKEGKTNRGALREEILDVLVIAQLLVDIEVIAPIYPGDVSKHSVATTPRRMEAFRLSQQLGRIDKPHEPR